MAEPDEPEESLPDDEVGPPDDPSLQPDDPSLQPDDPSLQPDDPSLQPDDPSLQPDDPDGDIEDEDSDSDEDSDDDDEDEDEEDFDDDEEGHPEPEVTIEVSSLSLYTHFGVTAAEREIGQRLIVDLRLDVGACDATVTDRVQDTVDYGEVCQLVYLISQQREYRTLERFCAVVADRLIERYDLHSVWVKASKPEPPIPLPLGEVSVEVWRET
jgi:dihydroneopterin aldolase